MRVLVTGANGFVGRPVMELLAAREGVELHGVGRGPHNPLGNGCTWHAADLLAVSDRRALIEAVRPSHLLHLAWYTKPPEYRTADANYDWLTASLDLLREFQRGGGQRAVFAGTCMEYDWRYGYCSESLTPLDTRTPYSACKISLLTAAQSFCAQSGLGYGWGRIFFAYGPHEPHEKVIPYVIGCLLRGELARCSAGHQLLDYIYVGDVAEGFVKLLTSHVQGVVNFGTGTPTMLRTLLETIGELLGKNELIEFGAAASQSGADFVVADCTRVRADLQWSACVSLAQGLRETIDWWRLHCDPGRTQSR